MNSKLFFQEELYGETFTINIYWEILKTACSKYIDYYNKETMKQLNEEIENQDKPLAFESSKEVKIKNQLLALLNILDSEFIENTKDTMNTSLLKSECSKIFDSLEDILEDKKLTFVVFHYFLIEFFKWCNGVDAAKRIYTWHCSSDKENYKIKMETIFVKELERVEFELQF
jgi:hypothetical protein